MNIFYFTSEQTASERQLLTLLEKQIDSGELRVFQNLPKMAAHLVMRSGGRDIVILSVANELVLNDILSLREAFDWFRTIVILYNQGREAVRKGHLLKPRYLTFMDNNIMEVAAVVRKMQTVFLPSQQCTISLSNNTRQLRQRPDQYRREECNTQIYEEIT